MATFTIPEFDQSFLPVTALSAVSAARIEEIMQRDTSEVSEELRHSVASIIDTVRTGGDKAVLDFTKKFDKVQFDSFKVADEEWAEAEQLVDPALKEAFKRAYENIYAFHKAMLPEEKKIEREGNTLGTIHRAIDSVALYVPGGKALYPSTVLMGTVPAQLAGVKRIALLNPPNLEGKVPPIVLWCAKLAGVTEVYKIGGAQAVAAAAYGTETIAAVEMVVGPGNAYVAEAKTQLAGQGVIAIDSPAGPSEVVIIADKGADPFWVACDLLAQAEHDEDASSILLTDSEELAQKVRDEVYNNIKTKTERGSIKWASIKKHGHIFTVDSLSQAVKFSNSYGPEHLEIMTAQPEDILKDIESAGSVFMGYYAPVAVGDYYSGPNHVLPTGGQARRYSGLSAATFLKRITYQKISKDGLEKSRAPIEAMSKAEGLYEEHGLSIEARFSKPSN